MAARTEPAFHIGEMRIELLRDPRLDRRRRRAESRGVDAQQDRRHCRPLRKMQPFEVADIIVGAARGDQTAPAVRSEEHTSELQSLMRISYAFFCLQKKKHTARPQIHLESYR